MKSHDFIFAVAIGLFGSVVLKAENDLDPDSRAQIEPAKKSAEKMGVKMPDIDNMMAEDTEEDAAAKKENKLRRQNQNRWQHCRCVDPAGRWISINRTEAANSGSTTKAESRELCAE